MMMLIRTDVYTDDLKIPVSPKEATRRYVYLWENPNSDQITSTFIEISKDGFTDVDFKESSMDYYEDDEMPEIKIENFNFDED